MLWKSALGEQVTWERGSRNKNVLLWNKLSHGGGVCSMVTVVNSIVLCIWKLPWKCILKVLIARRKIFLQLCMVVQASQVALAAKNPPTDAGEVRVQSLGFEDTLEESMATHSSILVWEIPWTEKLGGLQPTGLQRVGHAWTDLACMHTWGHMVTRLGWSFHSIYRYRIIMMYTGN